MRIVDRFWGSGSLATPTSCAPLLPGLMAVPLDGTGTKHSHHCVRSYWGALRVVLGGRVGYGAPRMRWWREVGFGIWAGLAYHPEAAV